MPLLFVAALWVRVAVIVSQSVNEPRVAVKREEAWLVRRE
jgi:hypothetical protein